MRGLMQEWPLLVHTFIDHAKIHHGEREIVTIRKPLTKQSDWSRGSSN